MQTKRLFVALDMPELFIPSLQEVQKQLLASGSIEGRAVPADQVHLTLQFLGSIALERVPMIIDTLKNVHGKSFAVQLDGLFALPSEQNPHVIAIDLVAPELVPLVEAICSALRAVITLDKREFLPHVTLVRIKRVIDQKKMVDILRASRVTNVTARVNEFVLRESVLSHEGAVHSDIMKYQLSLQQ